MHVAQPIQSTLDKVANHLIAIGSIEVESLSPGRLIFAGEIGPKFSEIISFWPEMVVDNIQDRREAARVAGVDQFLQFSRTTVTILCGIGSNPVVSPVSPARELRYRHDLDCRDTQISEFVKTLDDCAKSSVTGEHADMRCIENVFVQGQAHPSGVLPRIFRGIKDLRGAMNAVGLETRGWIRTLTGVVQEKLVANAGSNINIVDDRGEVSVAVGA